MGKKNETKIRDTRMSEINEQVKFIQAKNENQRLFRESILNNTITFATGPAGTGKSFISALAALELMSEPSSRISKVYLIKPVVGVDEDIGFLPGEMEKKMQPILQSMYYIFGKILRKRLNVEFIEKEGIVEVLPLQYMRGMNIDNAILILDEAQNTTCHQMKTLLTRIGENSKYVLSGDVRQCDRKRGVSGLTDAIKRLDCIDGIENIEFTHDDIVRNDIIKHILKAYEE